ncbi:hypothetical protein GGR54DRAFT_592383 [Hypoxylon sp. NC1633]|nr:hypothetical protein GGR54DRAFT_592383 [Hypoxylon sp. NC1633]
MMLGFCFLVLSLLLHATSSHIVDIPPYPLIHNDASMPLLLPAPNSLVGLYSPLRHQQSTQGFPFCVLFFVDL